MVKRIAGKLMAIVFWTGFAGLIMLSFASPAMAAETLEEIIIALDTIWVLIAAFLVFFMQVGFAMLESGFVRAKNAGNIIMKNFMDFCGGSITYWLIGFTIMFGVSANGLIGTGSMAILGDWDHLELGISVYAFLIFQTVFAATAATIVSGAVAERIKFYSYLIVSVFITTLIYPVVGHWIWGGGWLSELGFVDFAGSTVVHSVGGWAGLVGAYLIGARVGKYRHDGKVNAIPGHNITLGALGVFILWFGWFGFNGGSTISATDGNLSLIIVNTNLAAAAGGTMAMITTWLKYKKPDVSIALNGGLAGLVGITAGAADLLPLSALVVGALAGVIVVYGISFLDSKLKIDDPVGAISVHGLCGAFGTIMVGFFAIEGGLFHGGGITLLLVQLLGVAAVAAWVIVTSAILFILIKKTVGLRVSPEDEYRGLDQGEHGIEAYADFVPR